MSNNRIVEGIVTKYLPTGYVVKAGSVPGWVFLSYNLCPNNNMIGKWVRMTINSKDSACAPVEVIDNVFETRLRKQPQVLVKCTHQGSFNNRFEIFHNDYFGLIGDLGKRITNIVQGGVYSFWIAPFEHKEAKTFWTVSGGQDTLGPIDTFREQRLLKVTGIVIAPTTGGYFAWSNQTRNSTILLEYEQCNRDEDLLGKWVDMEINERNVVAKPVTVLRDIFQTEVNRGNVEIQAEFQHMKRSEDGIDIFHHHYFGNISDCGRLMEYAEPEAWYSGWIEFCGDANHSWWKISEVPKRWRQAESTYRGDHASRFISPGNCYRESRRRSSDAEHYEGERRLQSPDGRNNTRPSDSQNYQSSSHYYQRRRTPSPGQRTYRETSSSPRRYSERPLSPNYQSSSHYYQRCRTPSPGQRTYRETHSSPRRYSERPLSPNYQSSSHYYQRRRTPSPDQRTYREASSLPRHFGERPLSPNYQSSSHYYQRRRTPSPDQRTYRETSSLPRHFGERPLSPNYQSSSHYYQQRRTPSPGQRTYREIHSPRQRCSERPLSPNPFPSVKSSSSQYLGSEASSFVWRNEETTTVTRRPNDVVGSSMPYNPHLIARRRREKQALSAILGSGSNEYVRDSRGEKEELEEQIRQLQMINDRIDAVMSRFLGNKKLRDMLEEQD